MSSLENLDLYGESSYLNDDIGNYGTALPVTDSFLEGYYWTTLVLSVIMIVTACGTIATYFYGNFSDDSTSQQDAVKAFFGIAWVQLLGGLAMFGMSIFALRTRVGFGRQLKSIYNSNAFKKGEFANEMQLNELRSQYGGPTSQSTLPMDNIYPSVGMM